MVKYICDICEKEIITDPSELQPEFLFRINCAGVRVNNGKWSTYLGDIDMCPECHERIVRAILDKADKIRLASTNVKYCPMEDKLKALAEAREGIIHGDHCGCGECRCEKG